MSGHPQPPIPPLNADEHSDPSGRWWVAGPGESPQGPFDLASLRAMYRSGHLSAELRVCPEGQSEWRHVAELLGPPPVPPVQSTLVVPGAGAAAWTTQSLVLPILATLFCCLVGGIIAIVYTAQANTKGTAGDIAGALKDMKTVRLWLIISALTPVLIIVAYFAIAAIMLMVAMAATAPMPQQP